MARKRLSPLGGGWAEEEGSPAVQATTQIPAAQSSAVRPPIAHVAGEAAAQAALDEISQTLIQARETGRMVLELPLSAVAADHQIRDRMDVDPTALEELKASLRSRGQQAPIEVVETSAGRYGLISGWRRLRALNELALEAGTQGTVLALVRRPADAIEALVAMVEENEIRADLSFYERARIVRQSLQDGVFVSEKQALQTLFASASYARRSKIKSFLPVVDELGEGLRFPARISERLGLALSQTLSHDPQAADRLRKALASNIAQTPEAEAQILTRALRLEGAERMRPDPMSDPVLIAPGIRFSAREGRVELEGEGIHAALIDRLQDWLRSQG